MRFSLVTVGWVVLLTLAGCAATGVRDGDADSPTGGLALRVFVTDGGSSHALYVVEPDGTIAFGGGFDARNDEATWQGEMSAEEIATLRSLIDENGWLSGPPAGAFGGGGGGDQREYRVSVAVPGRSAKWEAAGTPGVRRVMDHMEHIASRRNQSIFDQLPEPDR